MGGRGQPEACLVDTRTTGVRRIGVAAAGILGGLLATSLATGVAAQRPAYRDPTLTPEVRAADLVSRMTLAEKVSQMTHGAAAIERLGVPEYNWLNEALHGVARSGLATVFPQAIGLAATWDEDLMHRVAEAISTEARAKHHEYAREGKRYMYQGLTLWSPNINLLRDPRWGRGQETYGEDPYLTGRMAVQFVRGLQGDDPRYLKTVATPKHFAVHSGPEPERHEFDAVVSERDLRESYLPQFRMAFVEGGASSAMCAYNRVDGEAACGSERLLHEILRGEWGFRGFVVSDCGAVDDIYLNHRLVATPAEAAAVALRAGTDLDCGPVYAHLPDAVDQGLVTEAQIDTAVTRLFAGRFRLGMFDPPDQVEYARIPYSAVDSEPHRALARQAARESMVLLRNRDGTLPLARDLDTLAVIGPNADQWLMLLGNYNGVPADPVTPLRGIREAVSPATEVVFAQGAPLADGIPLYDVVPAEALRTPDGDPGVRVEYFMGATDEALRDARVADDVMPALDADWRDRSPLPELDDDDFSVQWTGEIRPPESGTYRLGVISTTRYRFFLDDSLRIASEYHYRDELGDPRLRKTEPMRLEANRSYPFRIEAHETYGDAQVQLVWAPPRGDLEAEAVAAARTADAVVLVLGLTARMEGEEMDVEIEGFRGGDRTALELPDAQLRLLRRVIALGRPTVLVLMNGGALAVDGEAENIPAILEAGYPGQAAGIAIADVLFGDYSPGGRLPYTVYRSVEDLPPFEDYDMTGRTYRFFAGDPLYPFGHGLSYTTFEYRRLRTDAEVLRDGDTLEVSVEVENAGDRSGDEVVQLYVSWPGSAVTRPRLELKGFQRFTLRPGETRTVRFPLAATDLAYWNPDRNAWVLERGTVRLQVGASSADLRQGQTIRVEP